jgi:hypothetical protein
MVLFDGGTAGAVLLRRLYFFVGCVSVADTSSTFASFSMDGPRISMKAGVHSMNTDLFLTLTFREP